MRHYRLRFFRQIIGRSQAACALPAEFLGLKRTRFSYSVQDLLFKLAIDRAFSRLSRPLDSLSRKLFFRAPSDRGSRYPISILCRLYRSAIDAYFRRKNGKFVLYCCLLHCSFIIDQHQPVTYIKGEYPRRSPVRLITRIIHGASRCESQASPRRSYVTEQHAVLKPKGFSKSYRSNYIFFTCSNRIYLPWDSKRCSAILCAAARPAWSNRARSISVSVSILRYLLNRPPSLCSAPLSRRFTLCYFNSNLRLSPVHQKSEKCSKIWTT